MNGNNIAVGILGLGSYLPEKILTNFDLEKMVDTSNEWIIKRTGISERRIIKSDMPAYEMGIEASKKALLNAGICAEDLDLIIVTTNSPDYLTPASSCMIQKGIGALKAAAFDINAACSGSIYGLTVALQFIKTGYYKYVLVVSCESLSRTTDWEDRNTCVLTGDGAGVFVVGPVEKGYGIIGTHIGADGNMGHNITIPCCYMNDSDLEKRIHQNKRVLWMDGSEVFKFAVRALENAVLKVLADAKLTMDDIKIIVPHQANIRIIEGAAKRLNVPIERVYSNIHRFGNMSSATIPIALEEILNNKVISKGDNVVMVGFGGGLTWGSALIKWHK